MPFTIFARNWLAALALLAITAAAYSTSAFGLDQGRDHSSQNMQNSGVYENTGVGEFKAPIPGSYKLPPIKPAGYGEVLDHDGREINLKQLLAGRISILSFIYTSCDDPEGCPLATAKLFDLHDLSLSHPEIVKNAQLVSLSFDPIHDTPQVMKNYGDAALTDEDRVRKIPWSFLTTKSKSQITPILAHYGQVIDQRGTSSAISHLLRVYLVDRAGQVRNIYGLGFLDQRLLIADIKTLLLEEIALTKAATR